MPIICVRLFHVLEKEAIILSTVEDLSSFSYFLRDKIDQYVKFGARTIAFRCGKGERITLSIEDFAHINYICHCYRRVDGLTCTVVTDAKYSDRVAHSFISQVFNNFENEYGNQWNKIKQDTQLEFKIFEKLFKEYQSPENADKMLKVQKNLEQVKDILNQNISDILKRGESVENMEKQSKDLHDSTKAFADTARKANYWCCRYL